MKTKYNALRIIGSIFKILGIISGVITLLAILGTCGSTLLGGAAIDSAADNYGVGIMGGVLGGVVISLVLLLYGGVSSILLYATGESIFLFIDIEENTRTTSQYLRHLIKQAQQPQNI